MKARVSRAMAIALTLVALSACHPTPTRPSSSDVTGTWTGTTCPPGHYDACALILEIAQTDSALTGTYATTSGRGTMTGTIVHATLSLSMTPIVPATADTWSLVATVQGDTMSGSIQGRAVQLTREPH